MGVEGVGEKGVGVEGVGTRVWECDGWLVGCEAERHVRAGMVRGGEVCQRSGVAGQRGGVAGWQSGPAHKGDGAGQ